MAGLGTFLASELEHDENDVENCPLQCFNGGECLVHETTSAFYCGCPLFETGGFMGVHCEIPFQECKGNSTASGWRCLNGGMCDSGDSFDATCHCMDEWGGPRCEIFLGPSESIYDSHHVGILSDNNPLTAEAIIIVVAASLTLSFVCFMGGFHVGRNNREPVDFDFDDDELDGSLHEEYMNNELKTENTKSLDSQEDEEQLELQIT